MKIIDIYETLNAVSPFELQEKWDNSGLLVGDWQQEVHTVVLSIDIDEALLERVDEGTLIVSHHPIIFSGLKTLQFNQYPAKLLKIMIEKNITNIAMHTNFDQTHLNTYVAEKVLGLKIVHQEGFVAYAEVDEPFDAFARKIAAKLGLEQVKSVQCHDQIKRVALTTGSGASLMREIEADCFLTGDIKYHDAMEAKVLGLSMIDIGHFESERYFGEVLKPYLKNLGLTVIISSSKNPFIYL